MHVFPQIFTKEFVIKATNREFRASLSIGYFSVPADFFKMVRFLHPKEFEYYFHLEFERRVKSYLTGRYVAKKAVSFLTGEDSLDRICIAQGILHHPVVNLPNTTNVQVSITHCDDLAAAIAFSEELPMGIDIERISVDRNKVLETQMTAKESSLLSGLPYSYEATLTLFWTVKEALSKILKTGLTTSFHIYEISQVELRDGVVFSLFENFPQYRTASYILGDYVCSITYPKKTEWSVGVVKDVLHEIEQCMTKRL
ncbi:MULTISPECIES: 4'-phosphopantetheinyl transferase [Brevibacillus]|uniref:4'-phosphopantetheinyl transferase family protein n=1 Tax=Brevibacillus TaxID=55080 RepID=UPI001E36E1ED|nr:MULTISPECIES: 4'-phosphopantetheinyl transferase superfamily protein [Brevibacillus]MED1947228.1 4'-phosphopantetheinyl transferase superfamily protein [Brevibacillus formosus]MED1997505.1 4'-phosphopantetheinyl transferase superfamily protein [Brevibacillus formosus]MED2083362.1 4'-phosphopantetheinyl transferase superfamily protein [Brevibacillus formosus]